MNYVFVCLYSDAATVRLWSEWEKQTQVYGTVSAGPAWHDRHRGSGEYWSMPPAFSRFILIHLFRSISFGCICSFFINTVKPGNKYYYIIKIDVLKADVLHIIIGPKFILDLLSEGEFINMQIYYYWYTYNIY